MPACLICKGTIKMDSGGSCGLVWYSRVPLELPVNQRDGAAGSARVGSAGERLDDRLRPLSGEQAGDSGELSGSDADDRIAHLPDSTGRRAVA
jgi:hypothetical protein